MNISFTIKHWESSINLQKTPNSLNKFKNNFVVHQLHIYIYPYSTFTSIPKIHYSQVFGQVANQQNIVNTPINSLVSLQLLYNYNLRVCYLFAMHNWWILRIIRSCIITFKTQVYSHNVCIICIQSHSWYNSSKLYIYNIKLLHSIVK